MNADVLSLWLGFPGLSLPEPPAMFIQPRQYMELAPWLALWPGLCLTIVVNCFNMFGDAVRDLLDPRLKGGVGRMGAHGAKSVDKARTKLEVEGGKVRVQD